MMHKFWLKIKDQEIIVLLVILILAAFLRFYKLTDLFVFTTDEEYAVYLAQTIVKHFHFVWIGENAADTGFYMGPFWVYFTAFWLFLAKGYLWIIAFIASLIGLTTTLVLFLVGKKVFNFKVAAIASLLYATLPLIVYFDRKYWLLSPAPLVSILLFFSLYQTKINSWWWVLVGSLYGMVFHVHLSLVPFGLPILYLLWQQRKSLWQSKEKALFALAAFLIVVSPLIVFDYFHKASNITTPFRIGKEVTRQSNLLAPIGHLDYLFRTYGRLWYLSPQGSNADEVLHACNPFYTNKNFHIPGITTTTTIPSIIFSILSLVIFVWFVLRRKTWKQSNTRLLLTCFSLLILAFLLLPNIPLEYYLLASFPLFILIVGVAFASTGNKILAICLWLLVFVLAASGIRTVLTSDSKFGLSSKINLVQKISKLVGRENFELQEKGLCHGNEGWRYLFKQYGKLPVRSSVDDSLGYLYPQEISQQPAKYLLIMSETRIPLKKTFPDFGVIEEGGFRGYITTDFILSENTLQFTARMNTQKNFPKDTPHLDAE